MEITYKLENPAELVKSAKSKLSSTQDITYDECVALFAHYCKKAKNFFQIDPAWNISLNPDSKEDSASVTFTARYLNADIYFNPEYFRQFPLEIKKAAAHEIAHIFLGRIHGFLHLLPEEYSEDKHPFNKYYTDAYEEATTRMERLFFKYNAED